jgi:hypothetical protein
MAKILRACEADHDEILAPDDSVYREILPLTRRRFIEAVNSHQSRSPSLTTTPLHGGQRRPTIHQPAATEPGIFEFDNGRLEQVSVMLRLSYPFPHGIHIYPIMFRGYHIAGPARISFVLHSPSVFSPTGYAFLGRSARWSATSPTDREVVLELGTPDVVLDSHTGAFLHWRERQELIPGTVSGASHDSKHDGFVSANVMS